MADWLAGAAVALTPLYELMREKILEYDIVGNDDTPVVMWRPQLCGVTRHKLLQTQI
jgi:hypothetical protein